MESTRSTEEGEFRGREEGEERGGGRYVSVPAVRVCPMLQKFEKNREWNFSLPVATLASSTHTNTKREILLPSHLCVCMKL